MDSVSEAFRKGGCAIVVPHDRQVCLRKTLAALRPFGVDTLVVDNASFDGTAKMLCTTSWFRTLLLPKNLGGSGGFAAGMRWACAKGCRWLWLMDDDVLPLPGVLATFARHARPGVCLNPSKLTAEGKVFEFERKLSRRTFRRRRLPHAKVFRTAEAVPYETACFVGIFVDAHLAEGLIPPWQAFFLAWDDILFGRLASRAGQNLYLKDFCIQTRFDKAHPVFGGLCCHSTLTGRHFHLRNFCLPLRHIRRQCLGGDLAWPRFVYEWAKACALTSLARNPAGVRLLWLAWRHRRHGDIAATKRLPGLLPQSVASVEGA